MKSRYSALVLAFVCVFLYSSSVSALVGGAGPLASSFLMEGFSAVVEKTSPAVVSVLISGKNERRMRGQERPPTVPPENTPPEETPPENTPPPDPRNPEQSAGSGVIIDPTGYIVTNNHVVGGASSVSVRLADKREFSATIIGTDKKTDLAVIKIDAKNLPYIQWGDYDEIKVGHLVLAIGNPFGLSSTVTVGIISALGRSHVNIADYEDFIQTDAAINPGNSGGALVNMKGELIGINTAIFSQTGQAAGIGFAIPTSIAVDIVNSLIKTGKVVRGWMGVSIQEITPVLAKSFKLPEGQDGVLISDVNEIGPSHDAGILRGDVVVEFNGKQMTEVSQLRNMVAKTMLGQKALLKVMRGGKLLLIEVVIKERPSDEMLVAKNKLAPLPPQAETKKVPNNALAGLVVEDAGGADASVKGVVVVDVLKGSSAEQVGMKNGDVIMEVNHMKVANLKEYYAASEKITKTETVVLLVNRKGATVFVPLEPNKE